MYKKWNDKDNSYNPIFTIVEHCNKNRKHYNLKINQIFDKIEDSHFVISLLKTSEMISYKNDSKYL